MLSKQNALNILFFVTVITDMSTNKTEDKYTNHKKKKIQNPYRHFFLKIKKDDYTIIPLLSFYHCIRTLLTIYIEINP